VLTRTRNQLELFATVCSRDKRPSSTVDATMSQRYMYITVEYRNYVNNIMASCHIAALKLLSQAVFGSVISAGPAHHPSTVPSFPKVPIQAPRQNFVHSLGR
jgi:hypothetical protein